MVDISLVSFCVSLFDNAIFRYLFNIPVNTIASTVYLPSFCESYSGLPSKYWEEHSVECRTLFTNIIHIHTAYFLIIVGFIWFYFLPYRTFFTAIVPISKLEVSSVSEENAIGTRSIRINTVINRQAPPRDQATVRAEMTKLKNKYNEKFSELLRRLLNALERIKLTKQILICIQPFRDEFYDWDEKFTTQRKKLELELDQP